MTKSHTTNKEVECSNQTKGLGLGDAVNHVQQDEDTSSTSTRLKKIKKNPPTWEQVKA